MKKYVKDSYVIMHELILPNDTNNLDTVFGGKVMQYMDLCAAMSAYKFARTAVVTASVDRLDFLAPARVGDMLILKSSVNYSHNSSMEVGVHIDAENVKTGKRRHTASAYLTFVSLDPNGKPQKVNDIIAESDDEKRRYNEGKERHLERIQRLKGKK
ncbi:MAG: acyl-CoA thioesterase [Candidatus Marinimicrobia bacterium]|nr:acyl-CoA thioesterase [Candidatus Neomarinimicrobiota bacterium]